MAQTHYRSSKAVTDWSGLQPGQPVAVSGDLFAHDPALIEEAAPELGVVWIRGSRSGERRLLNIEEHTIWRLIPHQP